MTRPLILLGDSIFDNGAYVLPGEQDVATQLRGKVDHLDWSVDFRAMDGSMSQDITAQLNIRPIQPPCAFVLSVGGNDALDNIELLEDPAPHPFSVVLQRLYRIREQFRSDYGNALDDILRFAQPLIVCTIYNPRFPEQSLQEAAETAVSVFNDVIYQEARSRDLQVLELRDVCVSDTHYANPVEPSQMGGERITDAIVSMLEKIESQARI